LLLVFAHLPEEIRPFAIPGTKRVKYLEENAQAVNIVLTPDDLARIDRMLPRGAAAGERYPEPAMKAVNR
jgi:aryl-alcohol dehydrogenase-like predicted oxidoreductase